MDFRQTLEKCKLFARERLGRLLRPPRPDFSREPIELTIIQYEATEVEGAREESHIPVFSNVSPVIAKENGWVSDYNEYILIACLEFSRRYPNHELSKYWRTVSPLSDEDILAIAKGDIKLIIE
ncbi:MAG: hypothetical protein BWY68_00750 [bacterium ADurb.Bin400]|nr:MAG: hypothetical protein BWY68_00750 [bacterium ADurb.Bin400]